jgi:hypothetical protein
VHSRLSMRKSTSGIRYFHWDFQSSTSTSCRER